MSRLLLGASLIRSWFPMPIENCYEHEEHRKSECLQRQDKRTARVRQGRRQKLSSEVNAAKSIFNKQHSRSATRSAPCSTIFAMHSCMRHSSMHILYKRYMFSTVAAGAPLLQWWIRVELQANVLPFSLIPQRPFPFRFHRADGSYSLNLGEFGWTL